MKTYDALRLFRKLTTKRTKPSKPTKNIQLNLTKVFYLPEKVLYRLFLDHLLHSKNET
jgi:hypothetical protein